MTTKRFNQQVRRNLVRFPPDFMFQIDAQEATASRLQIATLKTERGQPIKYLRPAGDKSKGSKATKVVKVVPRNKT